MKKRLILVAAPPACGKTYVSELLAKRLSPAVYLDKDDLAPMVRKSFALCGEALDMDGKFYRDNLRSAEYETILGLAFSTLRFASTVILNAPLGKEVRDTEYMRALKEKSNALDADLVFIWVSAPLSVCYERIKSRNSDRDGWKIAHWEEYVKHVDYTPPFDLEKADAVDTFFIFDTANENQTNESMKSILEILGY